MDHKADATCPKVIALLFRLAANIAEQTGEQCAVYLFICSRRGVELPAELAGQGM